MLALLGAACFLIARFVRLGWLADYFSRPVLVGYIHGVAFVLIVGQVEKLLGLSIDARDPLAQLAEVRARAGRHQRRDPSCRRARARAPDPPPHAPAAFPGRARARRGGDRRFLGARAPGARGGRRRRGDLRAPERGGAEPRARRRPSPPAGGSGHLPGSFADEILTARSFAGRHNQHVRASQELPAMAAANAAAGLTRASRSPPVGHARRSTTRWGRAPSSPVWPPRRPSP